MAKIDSEDDLKRQMRRRLVGAVALVTALVIILPMIFESNPKQGGQEIELRIPDKDRAGAFTTQMVVAESAPDIGSAISAESSAASAPVAAPVSAAPPAAAKPEKSEPSHKPAPVKPTPTRPAPVNHPAAKPAPAKPEHHAAAPKAGFAVQVGAFAKAATAKELQGKLHKQGWHVYTQKAGDAVRVRVGPYPAREDAEKALHKLEAQGMHPAVVSEP